MADCPVFALLFISYYPLLHEGKGLRCIVFRFAFIILDILLHLLSQSLTGVHLQHFPVKNIFSEYISYRRETLVHSHHINILSPLGKDFF